MSCNLDPNMFARALAEHRADMKAHVRRRNVPPELLRRLGIVYEDLCERGCDQEALEIVRLILEGVVQVVDRAERVGLSYAAWRRRAVTSSFLGFWRESIEAYKKAICFGERGEYARVAEAHPGPGREAVYEPADRTQEALGGEKPSRFLQAAIDYVTAGKAQREYARWENGSYTSSFAAFDNALRVLDMVPDEGRDREHSDRESEARLQRGRTRMLEGDYSAALADLEEARSLTSNFNLVRFQMICPNGYAAPARFVHEGGRPFDHLGAIILGAPLARGAPGHVDCRPGSSQLDRYPASGSTRTPCNQDHLTFQLRRHIGLLPFFSRTYLA